MADDRRSPGSVAYTAYVQAVESVPVPTPILGAMWLRLRPAEQQAWESAARAVLEADAPAQAWEKALGSLARAVVRHWNEFGPGYGFDSHMNALETWLMPAGEEAP